MDSRLDSHHLSTKAALPLTLDHYGQSPVIIAKAPSSRHSRESVSSRHSTTAPVQFSSPNELPLPPYNAAMEALRRMRPPAKGATPVSDPDSMLPCGHHVYAMLVACSGTLAAGTALGFASAAMASIERQSWYDLPRVPPQNRWIADSLFLGATVGALFSGLLMHLVGHRTTLLLSSAGLISSWMCMALGNNVSMVLVGRLACGLFVGVVANCACLYVADVAPPAKRSTFGGLPEVATSAGILTAYSLAGFPWEVQAGGCALTALPTLALQRYIIENPRWLLAQDRSLDADTAVMRLYGIDPPPDFRQRKCDVVTEQQAAAGSRRWPKETR
ncbi:hypothetical protein HPB49_011239 [Dermacentor silvarum]|uniref:Uncharacterized protein n=1 Tax=Dermacentor silvarum TaxID=543639 RepID=A0ACB8DC23_DERSI|nr:hypothetical protein HPB49_011239 [Dermacentor silvarum]